ncbi:30S ribosomal protein S16 [Mycoplasma suis]|uniref:Small ribosomal subunit protein bS16 n=2 Tax=Mycoplasma suis TaxID=57372 RepID=F0QR69_MYCSL|nr:30S ribosomal protein S16 [Mycoplasma suis]ADX97989.1 30S ribosomal protein S16 [Mycoplasma suis str. Illinois]CBZ40486.1 Ribosomal protein S16 [Mycoplasma suis KI3806]
MVRIRLKKMGKKHYPIYRIVAVDARRSRDSAELDNLGFYIPRRDHFQLDMTLYNEFLSKGAQPTKNLLSLIKSQSKLSHK